MSREEQVHAHEDRVAPPSRLLLALEGRGMLELPALWASAPFLAAAPRGDGHAVVVLPGFGADDRSTVAIRRLLDHLGYDVHGWGRGRNVRAPGVDMPAVAEQVQRLWRLHDAPVSLVGWSRGGIMAREIARRHPRAVRGVITLGSPFAAPAASNAGRGWRPATGPGVPAHPSPARARRIARPIPVPSTSVYSRSDGVVAWRACLEPAGPTRENVEVYTTHSGLGFHPPVLWAIADRLAQPRDAWRPFAPGPFIAPFYPPRRRRGWLG